MNTTPSTDLTTLTTPDSKSSIDGVSLAPKPLHRKIAKLPKPLRDLINSMLDDAASSPDIIQKLEQSTAPSLPYPINEMDISRWRHSGYLQYLVLQERLACVQITREGANEMLTAGDTTTIPEASLQILATRYYEFFGNFDPQELKEKFAKDPLAYTRFLNVFSRMSRDIMNIRKYRDACDQARTELRKLNDPDRKLTDNETRAIVRHVDQILGIQPLDPESTPAAPSTEG